MPDANHFVQCDVAVVGAGMVGLSFVELLSAALPWARIALIDTQALAVNEEDTSWQESIRTTAISSQSVDIFRELGIWQTLMANATPISRVQVSDRGHAAGASFTRNENGGEALGYVLANRWLEHCLMQSLATRAQVHLMGNAKVSNVSINSSGAKIQLASKGEYFDVSCSLLVAADGARSSLRQQLGIQVDVYDYHQSAIVANVQHQYAHGGTAFERFTDDGPLALLPLGQSDRGKTSALVWTRPAASIETAMGWSDEQFLSALQARFGFRVGKFLKVSERNSFPLTRILAKEQVRSSLVLLGNAAHFLHPVAGQGFNLALRDALVLCQVLQVAHQQKHPINTYETLSQYTDRQAPDQWATCAMSHQFNRLFSDERRGPIVLRNLGLLGLTLSKPLKQRFFRQLMGYGDLVRQFTQ